MPELQTRNAVIWRHVGLALRYAGIKREVFAQDVVDLYHARTPLHLRAIEFHEVVRGGDVYATQVANKQLLFRMLDPAGPTRLAAEIEEAVVLALPQPYRGECLAELAARYGLLAAPLPVEGEGAQMVSCGEFAGEFGDCLKALAATIGDGDLDRADAGRAPAVIACLDALMAQATSLRAAHLRAIQSAGGPRAVMS